MEVTENKCSWFQSLSTLVMNEWMLNSEGSFEICHFSLLCVFFPPQSLIILLHVLCFVSSFSTFLSTTWSLLPIFIHSLHLSSNLLHAFSWLSLFFYATYSISSLLFFISFTPLSPFQPYHKISQTWSCSVFL